MGEISKKRGEFGEDVVEKLLNLIGWEGLLVGREIECFKPIEHTISTKNRKDHGVDFVYQYDCPLFNDTQNFVLISSKINDSYPSNPTNKFKSHLTDIAFAIDCFKKSSLRSKLKNQYARYESRQFGVIFWIDNKSTYNDIIDRLTDFKIPDKLEFETVLLVDNKRADFIFDSIAHAKNSFPQAQVEFLHPATGYNTTAKARIASSHILPVQYINSSILPIKIIDGTQEILVINCIDDFEEDSLKKLISLSQKLTENWAQKVYILFPSYNTDLNKGTVDDVKLAFKDQRFVSKVTVSTYNPNFRNVEQLR
ncbi:MAG: hypothetical protein EOP45_12425 [Sphingobacteriaceae bacterium]|nr:MAG: hypothetical protein EOP45_12425 [Sphingobacteriaceae bacterium]